MANTEKYKIGSIFGKWEIIGRKQHDYRIVYCKCNCGLEKSINVKKLLTTKCACESKFANIKIGDTLNNITIIGKSTPDVIKYNTKLNCRCNSCGIESTTTAKIFLQNKKSCHCRKTGVVIKEKNDLLYIGKMFNNIKVLSRSDKHKRVYYKCECVKCNHKVYLEINQIQKEYNCPKCKVIQKHEISYHKYNLVWYRLIRGAEQRGLIFDVTKDYIFDLLKQQNYKCAYTGTNIYLPEKTRLDTYTASLDRIDNNLGYVKGNLQWIHKDINRLKWKWSEKQFLSMVNEIYNYKIQGINNEA